MRLTGLQSKAELNGCEGHLGKFDQAKSRWAVHVDPIGYDDDGTGGGGGKGTVIAVKVANLEIVPKRAAFRGIDGVEV